MRVGVYYYVWSTTRRVIVVGNLWFSTVKKLPNARHGTTTKRKQYFFDQISTKCVNARNKNTIVYAIPLAIRAQVGTIWIRSGKFYGRVVACKRMRLCEPTYTLSIYRWCHRLYREQFVIITIIYGLCAYLWSTMAYHKSNCLKKKIQRQTIRSHKKKKTDLKIAIASTCKSTRQPTSYHLSNQKYILSVACLAWQAKLLVLRHRMLND